MYETLAILAAFVFFYSTVGGGLEHTPINGALVFTAFGLVFGPLGLDLLGLDTDAEGLRTLAELTLAMVLFTDASNADLGVLKKNIRIPLRLLLVGLPLTIVFGFGVGVVLFGGLTLFEIAILATMLAPTDAALGKAVVSDERVPANIRQGLNVESGLNDGICVPILFVFLGLAVAASGHGDGEVSPLMLVVEEIGVGAVVGIGLTMLAAWRLDHRELAAAAGAGAGGELFRAGPGPRWQRLHRRLCRRPAVRRGRQGTQAKVSAGGGGDRRHLVTDHMGGVRGRGGRSVDRWLQLAGGLIRDPQSDRGTNAAGVPGARGHESAR
jgi:hypothetical protein